MKFKIKKITTLLRTNIKGEVICYRDDWCIYKSCLFGAVRSYLKISPPILGAERYVVHYEPIVSLATFFSENEAKEMLRLIEEDPDRFVVYC